MSTVRRLLTALLVAVPLIDLALLIWLAPRIGAAWTFVLVFASMALGIVLSRQQGRRAWRDLQQALTDGRTPGLELVSGALAMLGGFALITPGPITDVVGLVLLVPPLRALVARALHRRLSARAAHLGMDPGLVRARMDRSGTIEGEVVDDPTPPRSDPTVIRGEIED